LALLALAYGSPGQAQRPRPPQNDLAAFPAPASGQSRHVIRLPSAGDEDALRVGTIIGQTLWVDCNQRLFNATLEERTAEGWGYTYHVVTRAGPGGMTQMACPPNSRARRFVRSADEPLLRYNPRLPLVIFAPSDVEIRYRIWRAGPERQIR
jgi:ecotin